MLSLIRRLFRREPPHLKGRVPAECGVGVLDDRHCAWPWASGTPGGPASWCIHQHRANGDNACGHYDAPWRDRDMEAARSSQRASEAQQLAMHNAIAPPRFIAARECWHHDSMGLPLTDRAIWTPELVECDCPARPSPAENAKRYSRPEWTW